MDGFARELQSPGMESLSVPAGFAGVWRAAGKKIVGNILLPPSSKEALIRSLSALCHGASRGPGRCLGGPRRRLQDPGAPGKGQEHPCGAGRDTQRGPALGPGQELHSGSQIHAGSGRALPRISPASSTPVSPLCIFFVFLCIYFCVLILMSLKMPLEMVFPQNKY